MRTYPDEFYIGWQPEAADGIVKKVRQFIFAICLVVPLIAVVVVMNQGGFSKSVFEYGKATEIEGVFTKTPAPFLQILRGNDMQGQVIYQNILLVAPGKHGIQEMLKEVETSLGHTLEGHMVKMKGFLIYHDGKTLMEVEEMVDIMDTGIAIAVPPLPTQYGEGSVIGEITDPKCLFGVMKPGYGKPHRSCAARCIAGGIPPVLKTLSAEGQTQYYLLAGEQGEMINDEILPYVGDQVAVCGNINRIGDWLVLYKDSEKDLMLLSNGLAKGLTMCR